MLLTQSWLRKARRASACSSRASLLSCLIASSRCAGRCKAMVDLLRSQIPDVPRSPAGSSSPIASSDSASSGWRTSSGSLASDAQLVGLDS